MKIKLTGRTVGNLIVGAWFGALLLTSSASWAGNVDLIPQGSVWKYEASGNDLGTAWRGVSYNDTGWPSGPAELGYGDGDEATLIPSSPIRYTYYFRRSFQVTDRSLFTALALRLIKDDGCVVYLNGQEVVRYNMPAGTITNSTPATTASEFGWEATLAISPSLLVNGNNVMAVEVHQANLTSSDVSFDLELVGTKPNITLKLDSPADGVSGMQSPATLAATATSSASQQLTVSFYGRPAEAVIPDFSIVVLPDTQFYTSESPGSMSMFQRQIDWVLANRSALNIVYVAHEGDISNNGDNYEIQWFNATNAMYRLDAALLGLPDGMPYGVAVGNHDQMVPTGDTSPTTYYNKYFGADHFSGRSYYGGHYGANNNNSYQLFSASGMDFIVLTMEYSPSTAALSWADTLLQQHPNHRAILVTHSLLETTGAWTTPGSTIYNALKSNTNLFLMLCGHNHGEARRTDVYNGHTIDTVLADYQSYAGGGNGFLRLLTFSPGNNEIRFQTYSPYINQYEVDASSEFTLSYPMGANFALITQNTGVPSGSQTAATWMGLQGGTSYEWFVSANDGLETQSSTTRTFTTSLNNNAAPTVTINQPGQNTTYTDTLSANIALTATASDSDGSVSSVGFFANGVSLGSTVTAPYQMDHTFDPGIYSITAVATDNMGTTSTSAPVVLTVDGTPAAPSELGVVAGSITSSSVDLTWVDHSMVETGLEILESTDGNTFVSGGTLPADTVVIKILGLSPDTDYWFKVRAFNSYGEAKSASLKVTTLTGPPNAPSNLSATEALETQVTLAWTDNSGNEDRFDVFMKIAGGGYVFVTNTEANVTSYTVTGLNGGTLYSFKVVAANSAGTAESDTLTVETAHPPVSPNLLRAIAKSSTEIEVTWQDLSDNEAGFEVLDGTKVIATTTANVSSTTVAGLTANTTYVISVRSFNAVGSSSSGEIAATTPTAPAPPNAPASLIAEPFSNTEIQLTWTDNSDAENGFRIERSLDEVTWNSIATSGPDVVAFTDTGLTSGTVYYYRVVAVGNGTESTPTTSAAAAPFVDSYVTSETLVLGTLSGSFANTLEQDSGYEQLTEKLTGSKNTKTGGLEHKWILNVPQGGRSVFYLDAYRGLVTDADEFVFAYSSDNVTFTDMVALTVTVPGGDYHSYPLPSSVHGTTYIRVRDSDRTPSATTLDSIYVDHLLIRTDVSPITTPPAAPTQIVAIAGDKTVTLSWVAAQGTITVYRRAALDGPYAVVATGVTGTSYQDTGLVNGTTYEYELTAVNEYGESAHSQTVAATPQVGPVTTDPPANLGATGSRKKITLTWTQSTSPGVTENKIYRSNGGSPFTELATISPNTTYIDIVDTGSTFSYRVTAVSTSGESAPSNTVSATAR